MVSDKFLNKVDFRLIIRLISRLEPRNKWIFHHYMQYIMQNNLWQDNLLNYKSLFSKLKTNDNILIIKHSKLKSKYFWSTTQIVTNIFSRGHHYWTHGLHSLNTNYFNPFFALSHISYIICWVTISRSNNIVFNLKFKKKMFLRYILKLQLF